MSSKSLRLRLALAAAMSTTMALICAGLVLTAIFERHVNRRIEAELDAFLRELAAEVSFTPEGVMQLGRLPGDPRFELPFSGHYWQLEDDATRSHVRSRSLWDFVITLPRDARDNETHRYIVPGPLGSTLLVRERHIAYPDAAKQPSEIRIAVAIDRKEFLDVRRAFADDVTLSLIALASILMLSSWLQISVGLRPLEALRRSVMAVGAGTAKRIDVDEPEEVMPLVAEVNSLLDAQATAIERARARAADLAHGLKTPLTVLQTDAARLREKGENDIAAEIDEVATGMRRHVERELARARLDTGTRKRVVPIGLRPVIDGVVRTLMRTPRGALLEWSVDIPSTATAAMQEEDLAELVGNILDNAVKWAEQEIVIKAFPGPLALTIEDDGPGVNATQLDQLGQRGLRLDRAVEGSGLGLAIAREILDAYGATMTVSLREPHGLRIVINQPPL